MLDTIAARLQPWHIVLFWVVAIVSGGFLSLVAAPHVRDIAGGLEIFDMRFGGYSQEDAVALLTALGDEGSRYYRAVGLVVDLVFPPALFLALSTLFIWLTRPSARFSLPLPEGVRLVVLALALIGFVTDWGENLVTLIMLSGGGNPAALLVGLGSVFTVIKGYAVILAILAVALTVVLAIIRGIGGRSTRSA